MMILISCFIFQPSQSNALSTNQSLPSAHKYFVGSDMPFWFLVLNQTDYIRIISYITYQASREISHISRDAGITPAYSLLRSAVNNIHDPCRFHIVFIKTIDRS